MLVGIALQLPQVTDLTVFVSMVPLAPSQDIELNYVSGET